VGKEERERKREMIRMLRRFLVLEGKESRKGTYFFLSSLLMNSTFCSTVPTAWLASPIVIVAGRRRYLRVIRSTEAGMVAE